MNSIHHALSKKTILPMAGLALLLSGCMGFGPEDAVKGFYRSVEKGEITKAQGYLSKQVIGMLGEQKLQMSLSQQSEKISSCGGIKDVIVELKGEGEIRKGTAKLSFKGSCPEARESVSMIKEDGKWKITADK